ncbi:serine hydrolase domain-containing protein [Jiangella anatolica]|uniref:Beta-lactamase-related domain-containing protein n=1 Tax=Jiangella anatolica TaxID=2670374 RepID=A0A2W2C456_9ACTN|nr:serine hydrolase domain-containing protein [Jiangella anatolica]PZF86728.1 hypothetical protein C1I92_00725 [Jiangella anatolica]
MTPPEILARFHLSADETARELSGSLAADQRFPIASVSKTLTALLAARLCADGVVGWTEPLRALLGHTAAVPFELRPSHWTSTGLTEDELAAAVASPPRLALPPGTVHYSNLGYGLAAALLERATGRRYPELLAEHVLHPLGLTRTSLPDERAEGRPALGAAAPAGDLWSTLDDLMTLARALDGHRPDVVDPTMLELLLGTSTPNGQGSQLAAGLRTFFVDPHRVLVSSGTIRGRTTCVTVWPRRGASVVVAEAGYSHDDLRDEAVRRWSRDDARRSWWWDAQEVVELRHGDRVELVLRETTWPYPVFAGRAEGRRLAGLDWAGRPVELRSTDDGDELTGPGLRLTAAANDSAYRP